MVNQNVKEYQGNLPSSRERQRIVNESGRDAVMFDANSDESSKIKLWDLIDESWTEPLEKDMAMNHYLRKVAYKCSACNETSLFEDEIKRHCAQVKSGHETHSEAELLQGIGEHGIPTFACSGCGAPMSMRKNQGQKHIDTINNRYDVHVKAGSIEILLTHKYAMSPSVDVPKQVIETIQFAGKPSVELQENHSVSEEPRSSRKRKRRRR